MQIIFPFSQVSAFMPDKWPLFLTSLIRTSHKNTPSSQKLIREWMYALVGIVVVVGVKHGSIYIVLSCHVNHDMSMHSVLVHVNHGNDMVSQCVHINHGIYMVSQCVNINRGIYMVSPYVHIKHHICVTIVCATIPGLGVDRNVPFITAGSLGLLP